MKILKLLLYPFAALYNLITRVRNYLYDIGHKPSFEFETPVIAVGNLNVGGSGKTPMVEYLIGLLANRYRVATLSRGYKRETKGYRLAQEQDTARSLGDEPFQLFRKFGDRVKVVVGEDRVFAIPNILQEFPDTDVILLDDALQHRSVKPQLSILVTEFSHPFYKDFVLPFGRLREARRGAVRSDIIVVTKCSEKLSTEEERKITHSIQHYTGVKPVFFSTIQYGEPLALGSEPSLSRNIVLVSGLAKSQSLEAYCSQHFRILRHFDFDDHHGYLEGDLKEIEDFCKTQAEPYSIITTEKDMVKLIEPNLRPYLNRLPWFYVPIRQAFLQNGLKFDELVLRSVVNTAGIK